MDIFIPDKWLREHLKTKASKEDIAKYLSLSGPSVERIKKEPSDYVYAIEVTTNRVDSVGVYGLAREASAILPRFKVSAKLLPLETKSKQPLSKSVSYLRTHVDSSLCPRFTAVLIKNVTVKPSPLKIQDRLLAVGVRPINNVVDISNYLMHELGQPMHTFDYDKIAEHKMILRESKKGEILTTLDGIDYTLPGGDIVIEDGSGKLIDLPGIMGGVSSMVTNDTKNVLLFVQTYEPSHIRKTSMTLAKRSEASSLFEKGLDTELVEKTIRRGIDMLEELSGGTAEKTILDIYPNPYKAKTVKLSLDFIESRLGIALSKHQVINTLTPLGFTASWQGTTILVKVPSWRGNDIAIPEDLVEEVARIYGYHNLPSQLMGGQIPTSYENSPFAFETKVKNILKALGGVEVYTLSLVPGEAKGQSTLRLKNPLGKDSEYLRTAMQPSLVAAAKGNLGIEDKFHIFELANIYLPRKNELPEERMTLAGIFSGHSYREAKGVVETLLGQLNIKYSVEVKDANIFLPNHRIEIKTDEKIVGELGVLENNLIYYEFALQELMTASNGDSIFTPIPKHPPQVENLTLIVPPRAKASAMIAAATALPNISKFELTDIYNTAYTFTIWYQHPQKNLTNEEVEKIRNRVLEKLASEFGASLKS